MTRDIMANLRKFSSQADPELLQELHEIAAREGRQFQSVLGDALQAYLAHKRQQSPRRNLIEAFEESLKERDELYRSLAK
jgi:predicted transcriptional regulator